MAATVVIWYFFSMSLAMFNKKLLGDDNFHYPAPMFITGIQVRGTEIGSRAEGWGAESKCVLCAAEQPLLESTSRCYVQTILREPARQSHDSNTDPILESSCTAPPTPPFPQFGVQYLICLALFRVFPKIAPVPRPVAGPPTGLSRLDFWLQKVRRRCRKAASASFQISYKLLLLCEDAPTDSLCVTFCGRGKASLRLPPHPALLNPVIRNADCSRGRRHRRRYCPFQPVARAHHSHSLHDVQIHIARLCALLCDCLGDGACSRGFQRGVARLARLSG